MARRQRRPRGKVLVALDGSPAASAALPHARLVAAQLGAAVEIIHVISPEGVVSPMPERLLRALRPGETLSIRLEDRAVARALLEAAAASNVQLLVMTTHGRDVEPGRRLGRVAEEVIARTDRPILLIRPESVSVEAVRPLRRLLLPLDGTPATAAALSPATELAGRLGSAVDLLHVVSPGASPPQEPGSIGAPAYVDQEQHEWPAWMSEVVERLATTLAHCPAGVPVCVHLRRGEIGEAIAHFAAERQVDAIVLVRRSHLEPGRARVLRAVLTHTPCPVVLLSGPPTSPCPPPEDRARAAATRPAAVSRQPVLRKLHSQG